MTIFFLLLYYSDSDDGGNGVAYISDGQSHYFPLGNFTLQLPEGWYYGVDYSTEPLLSASDSTNTASAWVYWFDLDSPISIEELWNEDQNLTDSFWVANPVMQSVWWDDVTKAETTFVYIHGLKTAEVLIDKIDAEYGTTRLIQYSFIVGTWEYSINFEAPLDEYKKWKEQFDFILASFHRGGQYHTWFTDQSRLIRRPVQSYYLDSIPSQENWGFIRNIRRD